jgi:hypothetical protein
METLTTAQAAEQVGVNVQKFFRLAARHGVLPVFEAPGKRGAKFWNPRDLDRLVAGEAVAS